MKPCNILILILITLNIYRYTTLINVVCYMVPLKVDFVVRRT
jgi:hypothetical protein